LKWWVTISCRNSNSSKASLSRRIPFKTSRTKSKAIKWLSKENSIYRRQFTTFLPHLSISNYLNRLIRESKNLKLSKMTMSNSLKTALESWRNWSFPTKNDKMKFGILSKESSMRKSEKKELKHLLEHSRKQLMRRLSRSP
jgi:hypothetical protein